MDKKWYRAFVEWEGMLSVSKFVLVSADSISEAVEKIQHNFRNVKRIQQVEEVNNYIVIEEQDER